MIYVEKIIRNIPEKCEQLFGTRFICFIINIKKKNRKTPQNLKKWCHGMILCTIPIWVL